MDVEIEQADGGFIIRASGLKKVFSDFHDLVQWLARHFNEVGVGEEWKP